MLADLNPGWCLHNLVGCSGSRVASSAPGRASTVKTLIKVAYLPCSADGCHRLPPLSGSLHISGLARCKVPVMGRSEVERRRVSGQARPAGVATSVRRRAAADRPVDGAVRGSARALADHPEASASELARLCFVTRQSLQDVLSGLRSSGLVSESDRPARGRARALELTAAGAKRLVAAHAAVMSVESEMTDGISPNARRQLAAALTRCAENLETG